MRPFSFFLLLLFTLTLQAQPSHNCTPAQKDLSFLKGTWIGQFTQYACGVNATYPMTVEITHTEGNSCKGFFIWSDLPLGPSSKTTLTGTWEGNTLVLHEDALVSGGNVVLDGYYEINVVDCTTLKGHWRLRSPQPDCDDPKALEDGGRFRVTKLVVHEEEEQKPAPEKRTVVVKDKIISSADYITIRLWDNGTEDGDIVTLRLNGQVALDHYEVTKTPHEIIIPLTARKNIIELYAENVGRTPPNTAAVAVISGGKVIKRLVLESDMKKSEAIKIVKTE